MPYPTIAENPFAVLTAVVAPAILTNASSVLALGTSNRLARVVDRTRVVAAKLASCDISDAEYPGWAVQQQRQQVRAQLLVKALRFFYSALGLFAAEALISIAGAIVPYYSRLLFKAAAVLAILTGASAVAGLAWGCVLMIRETRLAVQNLEEEAKVQVVHHPANSATRMGGSSPQTTTQTTK